MSQAVQGGAQRLAAAKEAAIAAADAAHSLWVGLHVGRLLELGTVDVAVESGGSSRSIAVPFAVTDIACALIEARSRASEAVLYAASGLEIEALSSAAAAYAIISRLQASASDTVAPETSSPPSISDALTPYLLASMVEEAAHVERIRDVTEFAGTDQRRAQLHARFADAMLRMIAAKDLQQTLLASSENEIDRDFLVRSKAFFA